MISQLGLIILKYPTQKTMKINLLISFFVLGAIYASMAQFTIDPNNPTVVCNATLPQKDVQSIADGSGGIYIFWYDSRTGVNLWDVYGQHYDANGTALWEANGREIINYDGPIREFSFVYENNGEFLFAFAVNNNTDVAQNGVYIRRMDANGSPVWEDDVKVFDPTSYPNTLSSARIVKSQNYYYVSTSGTLIGGANTCRIIKIDGNGNLQWPFNGSTIPGLTSFGSYGISSDQSGGLYVYASTGNGSGANLRCMRVMGIDNLSNAWPAFVNVTTGSQGLNYQYSGIGDSQGITFLWEGSGPEGTVNNLYSRRLLASTGLLDWNESTKVICGADGNQTRFYWKKSGNNYYIVWADGRPGALGNAIYAQKFTVNGILLWQENGIQVANLNSNNAYPEFDLDENNTMCVTHRTVSGFVAHKVSNEGEVSWGPNGVMTLNHTYAPYYDDYNVVFSQNKFITAGSNVNDIFMNKIHPAVVQVGQPVTACNEFTIYGETYNETGVYTINYDPDTTLTLTLTIINNVAEFNVDGLTLTAVNDGAFQWYRCDLKSPIPGATGPTYTVTESGSYTLQLTNGDCVDLGECIEVLIAGTDEQATTSAIQIFPNPGQDYFKVNLGSMRGTPDAIEIYNTYGQLVYRNTVLSSNLIDVSTAALPTGTYMVKLIGKETTVTNYWIKQ
jgi:hypothetical protein